MQICSVWLRGNSCKATGITVSLGIFFFPLPCTCRVDLNRVISSGVSFSKVNLTNSVVQESSQFVPAITLVLDYNLQGLELNSGENPGVHSHLRYLKAPNMMTSCCARCVSWRWCLQPAIPLEMFWLVWWHLALDTCVWAPHSHPLCSLVKSSCTIFLDWRMRWDTLRLHPVDRHHYGVDEMSEHQGYLKLLHHVANGPKYHQTWSRVPNCTTFGLQRTLMVGVLLLATQHNISLCPCFEKHQIPGMKGNLPIFVENFEGMGWAILNNSETSQTSLFLWILFHQSHWNFVCLCGNSVSRYHKRFAWHSDRSSILKYARWAYQ